MMRDISIPNSFSTWFNDKVYGLVEDYAISFRFVLCLLEAECDPWSLQPPSETITFEWAWK